MLSNNFTLPHAPAFRALLGARFLFSLALAAFSLAYYGQPARAASLSETAAPATSTPDANSVPLCLPGIYSADPQDCLVAGPADYLTRMGEMGISFPPQPIRAQKPDPTLANVPYYYVRLKGTGNTPVYASLDNAIAGQSPTHWIEAGDMIYLSYIDEVNVNDSPKPDYFQLRAGGWVAAGDVASRSNAFTHFQGLTFGETPVNSFGWVLPLNAFVETKQTPGYAQSDYTGHQIIEYGVVQIYATQQIDDTEWYMVGPDEWLPQHTIGRVLPNATAPAGVTGSRWIEVNLFEQTLAVYEQGHLVFASLIATGVEPFYTRPGVFPIYKKLEVTPMRGAFEADRSDFYYLEDVPYTMYYDQARALHAAYWRTRFGFPQSHGCVNLSPGDARWLFEWAQEGDFVYVWDPSGETPTDPSFYGEGGA